MAVIKQGGGNPYGTRVMTTRGYKNVRPPLCYKCRERKEGVLYTVDPNGNFVCADCAGRVADGALKGVCQEGECACGADCPVEDYDGPTATG